MGVKQNRHVPPIGSWGDSTLATRAAKTFVRKTQKGRVHHFPGTTEAGSRPLLSQPSPTPQRAAPRHADLLWHRPPEALPCWTGGFACPAAHLAPETLPCRTLTKTGESSSQKWFAQGHSAHLGSVVGSALRLTLAANFEAHWPVDKKGLRCEFSPAFGR